MHNIPLNTLVKCFQYLDKLRAMGKINMFGAPAYLATDMKLSQEEAKQIWSLWASSFTDEEGPEDRAKEVKKAFAT